MSAAGQIKDFVEEVVAAAVAPLLPGLAALTNRVTELEKKLEDWEKSVKTPPAKKATAARAGTAGVKAEAQDSK